MITLPDLYARLPEHERLLVDILRQIIQENLPSYCKEKLSFGFPFFYGKRGICIIWPASIPGGGIKSGVLLGFWHGNKIIDHNRYLTHGSNRQVFYKIFHSTDEIDEKPIKELLTEAIRIDLIKSHRLSR